MSLADGCAFDTALAASVFSGFLYGAFALALGRWTASCVPGDNGTVEAPARDAGVWPDPHPARDRDRFRGGALGQAATVKNTRPNWRLPDPHGVLPGRGSSSGGRLFPRPSGRSVRGGCNRP